MTSEQDALVREYLPLAGRLATMMAKRCPSFIERDELFGVASEALARAVVRMRPEIVYDMNGYLGHRVWCGMLDYLRQVDPNPRGVHKGDPGHVASVSLFSRVGRSDEDLLLLDTIPTADFADRSCRRLDLIAAIRTMPERERLVVLARMVGVPGIDLARRLGVTESRVSQLRRAGIRRLRAA